MNRYGTKKHIKSNLKSWANYIFYEHDKDKENENEKLADNEKCEEIAEELFKNLYDGTDYFWDEEEFKDFLKREKKCKYCDHSEENLEKFYCYVDSYRYTRGKSLEIDRKSGRMKDYFKSTNEENDFINKTKKIIDNIELSSIADLKIALKALEDEEDEEYLHLPAPYNSYNCVFACYWCNNAKTDAFTDEEFEDIGLAIGVAIEKVIEKEDKEKEE